MESILILTFFLLGAVVASFVGVISGRLNTGQSFVDSRSRCDACDEPLSAFTLIPIISYIVSRGRALCCGVRLSPIAPLTEMLLGALYVLSFYKLGFSTELVVFLVAISLLLALVLYDLAHQILPPALLFLFVISAIVFSLLNSNFMPTLYMAVIIGGSLALIHFASRGRAMGLSDAPLAFGLALLTGATALTGFVLSFWIGAVVGIILLLQRPRGSRMGVEVPFAPYLAAGFLLAYFTQWNLYALIIS